MRWQQPTTVNNSRHIVPSGATCRQGSSTHTTPTLYVSLSASVSDYWTSSVLLQEYSTTIRINFKIMKVQIYAFRYIYCFQFLVVHKLSENMNYADHSSAFLIYAYWLNWVLRSRSCDHFGQACHLHLRNDPNLTPIWKWPLLSFSSDCKVTIL